MANEFIPRPHHEDIDESTLRKMQPIGTLIEDYFPDALRAVAAVAWAGDRKHNPGKPADAPPEWNRDKSTDHVNCLARHIQGGAGWDRIGDYEVLHAAEAAWRALARLQLIVELRNGEVIRKIAPGPALEARDTRRDPPVTVDTAGPPRRS